MKKFNYLDSTDTEFKLHKGDVEIADVPLLNDKLVNYDSHIGNNDIHVTATNKTTWNNHVADGVIHVTSGDKTTWNNHVANTTIHVTSTDKSNWNGHISNNDIHVTSSDKTSWNNHIADNVRHITSAERTLWNSGAGGLKPFTNCFYVDANFTNSAPYFNNLTDAINSATNTTLIIVNGTFNLGSISTNATTINLISAHRHSSTISIPNSISEALKTLNFYDFKLINCGNHLLEFNANFRNCLEVDNATFVNKAYNFENTILREVLFSTAVVAIKNTEFASVSFVNCSSVELSNIVKLTMASTLSSSFFTSSSSYVLPKLNIVNCIYKSYVVGDVFQINSTGSYVGFKLRLINSMFIVSGDTGNSYKIINYNPSWTATSIFLIDNCVFSGENDNTNRDFIAGTGKIYSRASLVVGSASAIIEGDLQIGSRSYVDLGF